MASRHPWVVFKAISWLNAYLKPNMLVFEYGAGGSTFFFSRRVKNVISVEHDKGWHKKVEEELIKRHISNCSLFLFEPEKIEGGQYPVYDYKNYTSTGIEGVSFKKYVTSIDSYLDGIFDLVFIDGRSRASCIFNAVNKVRRGGYLLLDNSERKEYQDAMSLLNGYERTDFFGVGPSNNYLWQTSVWRIE